MPTYDIAIIGGGIVGCATAYRLAQQHPDRSIAIIEKEDRVAFHQTGRNSGVIHSGVFYTPGSLKAENCREGKRALVEFCEREGVDYDMCGKVVVATSEEEIPELDKIQEKGQKNDVACTRIGPERLRELEPHTRGVAALHVPGAGIVDYTGMTERMAAIVQEQGHALKTNAEVRDLHVEDHAVTVETTAGDVTAKYVVNCAGLYADRIAEMSGMDPGVKIVPFRGEYYELVPERQHLCNDLIYPVPDPAYPFLGVHFTRMIDGRVECGPSAVLAFAREGYMFGDVNVSELLETITYPGFIKLSLQHWQKGIREIAQSLSKRVYVNQARKLIPELEMDDVVPSPSGVRAQALRRDGSLVDDFLFVEGKRVINAVNVASPAATASLNIGRLIVDRLSTRFSTAPAQPAS
jgi:L-2-hydroxyglutarate oxidase